MAAVLLVHAALLIALLTARGVVRPPDDAGPALMTVDLAEPVPL